MASNLAPRPLVKWDGFSLHIDLDILEHTVNGILSQKVPGVELLSLDGEGETLEAHVRLEWKGFPAQVGVRIGQLRLHRRFFGCRLLSVHGPFGLPLPVSLVGALVRRVAGGIVHFDHQDGILLAELHRYIPEGIELRIASVTCRGRWLEITLAPGSLAATLTSRLTDDKPSA
jgi:hypothetical protein